MHHRVLDDRARLIVNEATALRQEVATLVESEAEVAMDLSQGAMIDMDVTRTLDAQVEEITTTLSEASVALVDGTGESMLKRETSSI